VEGSSSDLVLDINSEFIGRDSEPPLPPAKKSLREGGFLVKFKLDPPE
jgi:hypothetical protein